MNWMSAHADARAGGAGAPTGANDFPLFTRGESIVSFMRRVEQFNLRVKRAKYETILAFVNKMYGTGHTSLTDVRNVPARKMIPERGHWTRIMEQHREELATLLNTNVLELTTIEAGADPDATSEPESLVLLKRLLTAIDYALVPRITATGTYYSIRYLRP